MDDLRKLLQRTPWWAWVLAGIVVIVIIASIRGGSESNDNSKSEKAKPAAASVAPNKTTASKAASNTSDFHCLPEGIPEVCSIAKESFDRPLEAFGPIGDKSDPNFYGVDYSFALDDKRAPPELVAAQAEAQMAIVYKATAKKLRGQINYVTANAYGPGADPFKNYALLSTSIGSAEIDQIAGGASPLGVWQVDHVAPALLNLVG